MNRRTYLRLLTATAALLVFSTMSFLVGCGSSSSHTTTTTTTAIAATSGGGQSVAVGTAFAPLVATVTVNGSSSGVSASVTFTAPASSSGASCNFSNNTNTETDTTTNGVATSSACMANSTPGTYSVTASTSGAATPAAFALTNTSVSTSSNTYVFYASGEEASNGGNNYYAVAGAVTIGSNGTVTGGEQDYNDAFGFTSPGEPNTPDLITGGTLTVDATTGQGTLTMTTNDSAVNGGTETFGVQFVNLNHALIMEYDGNATSSGSLDLQTMTNSPGNFAFAISGVDDVYSPVAYGGVYAAAGGSVTGTIDVNDGGTVVTGTAFTATVTNGATVDPAGLGRAVVTGVTNPVTSTAITFASYTVGGECIRIIDVDAADSAVGSAFGQGSGTFNNTSLGASAFGIQGNWDSTQYAAAGQFGTSSTSSSPADFSGVGDETELGNAIQNLDASFAGTYDLQSSAINGYGSMSVTSSFGDFVQIGLYMTDPALNLNDPNNTTTGLGGALIVDLDDSLSGGTGVVTPQSDPAVASFSGNYAAGWQNDNLFQNLVNPNLDFDEFDLLAQGTMTSGSTLNLTTGLLNDPFGTLALGVTSTNSVSLTGTPQADSSNLGRFTMESTSAISATFDGTNGAFDLAIYQADGGQLFWTETDGNSVFLGPLEQQSSLTGLPTAREPVTKLQAKQK